MTMHRHLRTITRRLTLAGLAALGAACLPAPALAAEAYPHQAVNIIVPFAPGGSLDATARVLADKLKDVLGQPVLVVNKPGAGSAVGARYVAQSRPDGYNIFIASGSAYGFLHLLVPNFEFKVKDFAPLGAVAVYVVALSLVVRSMERRMPKRD